MSAAIAGERRSQTLSSLLASPANRVALFLGRALPSIVTGVVVAATAATICGIILDVEIARSQVPPLLLVALVSSFGCTALGLCLGSLALRGRNVTLFADVIAGLMLIVSGANVPLDELPDWVQAVSSVIPLTHGIEAAREVAAGVPLGDVSDLVVTEWAIGAVYLAVGLAMLRFFEWEGRRSATFETF
jgi:ABC-2 type transport system permease protein